MEHAASCFPKQARRPRRASIGQGAVFRPPSSAFQARGSSGTSFTLLEHDAIKQNRIVLSSH